MLLEALIAILIFSLGVIAIVQLQAVAVKQSTDAEFRSTAALLASDLVSRMWSGDRTQLKLQEQFGQPDAPGYAAWFRTVQASGLPNITQADHMPKVDIAQADGLPAGASQVTITLSWQMPGEQKDPDAKRHEYVTIVVLR